MTKSTLSDTLRKYPDTKRKLWCRHTLPFLLWLGWVAVLTALFFLWIKPQYGNTPSMVIAPTVWLILCILPFFLFKIPQKLFDHSFEGTILTAEPVVTYKIPIIRHPAPQIGKWEPSMNLTVRTTDGKVILVCPKVRAPAEPYPHEVGQKVVHLRGSEHLIVLTESGENSGICPLCGAKSAKADRRCDYCGRPLIQFGDTFKV